MKLPSNTVLLPSNTMQPQLSRLAACSVLPLPFRLAACLLPLLLALALLPGGGCVGLDVTLAVNQSVQGTWRYKEVPTADSLGGKKITIFLSDSASQAVGGAPSSHELAAFISFANSLPAVSSVSFTSKEQALERYKELVVDSLILDLLDGNPLPASLEITLNSPSQLLAVQNQLMGHDSFEHIVDRPDDPFTAMRESEDSVFTPVSATQWFSNRLHATRLVFSAEGTGTWKTGIPLVDQQSYIFDYYDQGETVDIVFREAPQLLYSGVVETRHTLTKTVIGGELVLTWEDPELLSLAVAGNIDRSSCPLTLIRP